MLLQTLVLHPRTHRPVPLNHRTYLPACLPEHRVLNRDYLREKYPSRGGDPVYKHMSLITSGMGDVSEDVISTVAAHDADATSSYTAHAAEELNLSAILAEDETVIAQLPVSAFFGFPGKEDGQDVKGDCVLALTCSSGDSGQKRLLFVYTGQVERSLKGNESYSYVKPCFTCGTCFGGETITYSADFNMGRTQESGFRIITVADQLVDVYSSSASTMDLHKHTAGGFAAPTADDCCKLIDCLKYWCGYGPCLDLCTLKPCCRACGKTSCCEPQVKNKAFSLNLSEHSLDIQDLISTWETRVGEYGGTQWNIETQMQSLNSVVLHWCDPRTNQLRETTAIISGSSRSEIAKFVSLSNHARFRSDKEFAPIGSSAEDSATSGSVAAAGSSVPLPLPLRAGSFMAQSAKKGLGL